MTVSVCVHGHFYQPPRDNPWLGSVPCQPSAAPAHDWNERVTQECYRANVGARVWNERGELLERIRTYDHISFDMGPTLMRWMQTRAPDVHQAIVQADRRHLEIRSHGGAMAQSYHHTILPLDNARDRQTQIHWGLQDFKHRFGRDADGMWMPECAVNTNTLEDMAAAGVQFTLVGASQLLGPDGTPADPRFPHTVRLPSSRSIVVFAYDEPTSQGVAFDGLLHNGDRFLQRLTSLSTHADQLAHIATDGESYGHHHEKGEMALAWMLRGALADPAVHIHNYASFLAAHPADRIGQIREGSSWSCAHGVDRWRKDCGCGVTIGHGAWRTPLREAFEQLSTAIHELTEEHEADRLIDLWAARNDYVRVLLDPEQTQPWVERWVRSPSPSEATRALTLMEVHRCAMEAFTSCAWFFDDVGRIEPQHNIACAWRAAELAQTLWPDVDLLTPLQHTLSLAKSADADLATALDVARSKVLPIRIGPVEAGAHWAAVRCLFPDPAWRVFRCDESEQAVLRSAAGTTILRRVTLTDTRTRAKTRLFCASQTREDGFAGAASLDDGRALAHWAEQLTHSSDLRSFDAVIQRDDLPVRDRQRIGRLVGQP